MVSCTKSVATPVEDVRKKLIDRTGHKDEHLWCQPLCVIGLVPLTDPLLTWGLGGHVEWFS